ncbi:hypothetical protein SETIT_6G042700v2 [Setaria italica]|uniref:Uncharacterized protein n=1 Tax=Setaria italica TaxID=4555 RepID=A0A368RHX9_SETIT|nr:hypothetical protein SETIT_6G042700v2 [Setaria italica]
MSGGVGLVTIFVLVVFGTGGVLVMPAHCKCRSSRLFDAESMKATTTDSNSTSVDESKIHLVFCIKSLCETPKKGLALCFCCQKSTEPCYNSVAECQAHCPACNPKCQLQSPAADSVMGSRSPNVNAIGKLF